MKKRTAILDFARSTKNTHVYQLDRPVEGEPTTSIYLLKDVVGGLPPSPTILVTIQFSTPKGEFNND